MTALYNNAAGGTDGVVVSTTNSGAASGNAWSVVKQPSGTSIKFAAASSYSGTLGYRMVHGSGSGSSSYLRWSITGWTQARARFYFKVSAYPTVQARVAYIADSAGHICAHMILTTSGALGVQEDGGTDLFSSGPVPLNTWIRAEWIVAPGTNSSNGTMQFGWATGDTAIAGGNSFSSNTVNVGTKTLGDVTFGKLWGTWNSTSDWDEFVSDNLSSTTFIGPVSTAPAPPVVVQPPVVGGSAGLWPPDPYRAAIRGAVALSFSVSAFFDGEPVAGASDLRPVGGSVTDTSKPGVRRVLNLELAPSPGLFDLLSPVGTQLRVSCRVTYTDRSFFDIPMGVFDVDSEKLSAGSGSLSLTAPDKWAVIQRARFVGPAASITGMQVREQIVELIRGALGADEPVSVLASTSANVGALTWEKDRAKAIIDLATSIGAWVYFDRDGVATLADLPVVGASADWLIDASPTGVLTALDRERSRTETFNVVVVESSAAEGELFPTQWVWDDDPSSPTYAGTDPRTDPGSAGPFGISTYYFDTPLPLTVAEARTTGMTILARTAGLASQVSLEEAPNPAIDSFNVIDVLPPQERFDISRSLERHIVDTVTHPLTVGSPQHIDGRSTRADAIAGGS